MKKVLFLDRDGTLVIEPPDDYQVDSLEKLTFYPLVFQYLAKIARKLDFELVIVTNQDGLGTETFPEETFWPAHHKMIEAFANEGIVFSNVLIDKTFPDENAATRKPGTGMLTSYLEGEYDLAHSFVIGDRLTDMELAENLGAKGILIAPEGAQGYDERVQVLQTTEWKEIYRFLALKERRLTTVRKTNETEIKVSVNLDGRGLANIKTGIAFFDHMLEQLCKHAALDLDIQVDGDLEIDEHHSIEDTAITLGEAFYKVLGDKTGMARYGFCLPMDDCLAQVAIDFGGRSWLVWEADFKREMIGKMPTEMFFHFFKSFSDTAKCNIHIKADGVNEHHKIEAIFKAFAKAIKMAIIRDTENQTLMSTKGVL